MTLGPESEPTPDFFETPEQLKKEQDEINKSAEKQPVGGEDEVATSEKLAYEEGAKLNKQIEEEKAQREAEAEKILESISSGSRYQELADRKLVAKLQPALIGARRGVVAADLHRALEGIEPEVSLIVMERLPKDLRKTYERCFPPEKAPKPERKKLFTLAKEKLSAWWQKIKAGLRQKKIGRLGEKYFKEYRNIWELPESHPSVGL